MFLLNTNQEQRQYKQHSTSDVRLHVSKMLASSQAFCASITFGLILLPLLQHCASDLHWFEGLLMHSQSNSIGTALFLLCGTCSPDPVLSLSESDSRSTTKCLPTSVLSQQENSWPSLWPRSWPRSGYPRLCGQILGILAEILVQDLGASWPWFCLHAPRSWPYNF